MDEFALIQRYFADLTPLPSGAMSGVVLGIGDDAAILSSTGFDWAITTDTLLHGVHFDGRFSPQEIGWRSLAVNLSDVAAMGAKPHSFLLSLTLPQADEGWLQGFSEGLQQCALQHACALVGGNTARGALSIGITALGTLPKGKSLRRGTAKVGDQLCISGVLGVAAAALQGLDDWQHVARPQPQLALGQALLDVATSAMDVSDGLAGDLPHLLKDLGAQIDFLPLHPKLPAAEALASDDYHLLFTLPPDAALPVGCFRLGSITDTGHITGHWPLAHGYRHF